MTKSQNAVIDYKYDTQEEIDNESYILKEIKIKRHNRRIKFGLVAKTIVVFIIGLLILYRYASITEINYKVNSKMKEYNNLKNENDRLSVDIAKSVNLQEIRRIAEERLEMQKPGSYQIIHISVPPVDQTELQNIEIKTNNEMPWYDKIFKNIKQFFGIM